MSNDPDNALLMLDLARFAAWRALRPHDAKVDGIRYRKLLGWWMSLDWEYKDHLSSCAEKMAHIEALPDVAV